jgi:hypothetical protein
MNHRRRPRRRHRRTENMIYEINIHGTVAAAPRPAPGSLHSHTRGG